MQAAEETGVLTLRAAAGPGAVFRRLELSVSYDAGEDGLQLYLDTGAGERIYANYKVGERTQEFDLSDVTRNAPAVSLTFVLSPGTTLRAVSLTGEDVRVVDDSAAGALRLVKTFDALADYDTESWSQDALEVKDLLVFGGLLGTGAQGRYAGAEGYVVYRFAAEGKRFDSFSVSLTGRLNGKNLGYKLRLWGSIDNGATWTTLADEQGDVTGFARTYDLTETFGGRRDVLLKLGMYGDYWHSVALSKLEINASYRFDLAYETGAGTAADNPTSYVPGDSFALQSPTPPAHCRFEGWYETPDFSGEKVTEIAATDCGAKTLYAKYAPIAHNIVYHLNGGKNAAANPDTFAEGEGLTLAAPTRTGYSFAGWYERADFSGDAVTNLASGTTKDVELYAKWAKNYRITYVLNGGTLADRQESFSEIEEVTLGEPAREGYVFAGWYESADFAGERVERLEAGTARAVTLYAKWETAEGGSGGCGSAAEASLLGLSLLTLLGAGLALKRKRAK